jgi:hypothetical protein
MVTKPAQYVKTQDGWKLNSDTKPTFNEGDINSDFYKLTRKAGIPEDEAAILLQMAGDNKDTVMGYVYAKAFEDFNGNLNDFVHSSVNANKPAGSVAFDRNYEIAKTIDGMSDGDAMKIAQLFDNGGIKTQTLDTGEIIGIDPQGNTTIIRDLETAMEFGEKAQRNLQSSEDELGQYDSIVTQSRELLDTNDKSYGEQRRGIRVLDRWEEKINGMSDKEFDDIFGWGNQLMYDFFGKGHPTLAALNSVTTYEGLQTLANEANLAPVSNMEFTKVAGLLGSGKIESKEQLLALFEEARFRTDDKIERIIRENEYHLNRLNKVPNKTWYNMYSERPYMTEAQTLEEARK